MSHFQRTQYRVAGHYAHQGMYPGAPLRVHPVMPLMPYEAAASATSPYGAPESAPEEAGGLIPVAYRTPLALVGVGAVLYMMFRGTIGADMRAAEDRRSRGLRSNPSAPGRTDTGPEDDIASLPKAVEQETRLVQNVFKKKV
jgi:hypothetical protein